MGMILLCFLKSWLYQLFLERLYKTFKPTKKNKSKRANYALSKKSGVNEGVQFLSVFLIESHQVNSNLSFPLLHTCNKGLSCVPLLSRFILQIHITAHLLIGGPGDRRVCIRIFSILKAGLQIRILIILGSWIRIRIREKSWIRIRIKVEIQELQRLKKEPWWAADADKRDVRAQNGALEGGSLDQWSRMRITLMSSKIRIRLRSKVKRWIRNRIEVKNGSADSQLWRKV